MTMHHKHTLERAPFFKGREPVKLTAKELRELNAQVGLAPRNMAAIEAVLVKRLPFVEAGRLLGEKSSYVRGAYIWGMKQFGLVGSKAFEGDAANRLIVENVPARFHARFTAKIEETVAKWLAEEREANAPAWQTPQPVETQDAD